MYATNSSSSVLGSLLRKVSEDRQSLPLAVPQNAAESSPIRAQVQAPITAPESTGSDKMVSIKPELNPAQGEVVNAMGAGSPVNAGNGVNVPSPAVFQPEFTNSGIISPVAPQRPVTPVSPTNNAEITPTASTVSTPSVNNARVTATPTPTPSKSSSPSASVKSLMPTYLRAANNNSSGWTNPNKTSNLNGTITKPSSQVPRISLSTGSAGAAGAKALSSIGDLLPTAVRGVISNAGKIIANSSLAKLLQEFSMPTSALNQAKLGRGNSRI